MTNKLFATLLPALLSTSGFALAEICSDVLSEIDSNNLSVQLQATEPWYLPGESVRFKLVFQNRSKRPISIPPNLASMGGDVARVFLIKSPELPEGIWMDVVNRSSTTSMMIGWQRCKVTSSPRVLLPGEVHNMDDQYLNVETAPSSPGLHKFRYSSDFFQLLTDLLVKPIESYDMRWLSDFSSDGKSVLLRAVWLFRVDGQSLLLIDRNWNRSIDTATLPNYPEREAYFASWTMNQASLSKAERVFAVPEELQFTDREGRSLPVNQEFSLSSKGSVVRRVNPNRYRIHESNPRP